MEENNNEQLTTEVTSVAKEEERTGEKLQMPSGDELAARASASFIRNMKQFNQYFINLSSRAKGRVMNAVLDLPANGVPVFLKTDEEKRAFGVGQRLIADRFIITQHYIVQEAKRQKEAAAKAEAEKSETEEKTLDNEADKS